MPNWNDKPNFPPKPSSDACITIDNDTRVNMIRAFFKDLISVRPKFNTIRGIDYILSMDRDGVKCVL